MRWYSKETIILS